MAVSRIVSVASFTALSLLLSGCTLSTTPTPAKTAGMPIQGVVHGGAQPIVGANIYLLEASTAGYGAQSKSLLTAATGSTPDAIGYFVVTGAGGHFSITGDYACDANAQVYLYAKGGNSGAGSNSGIGLLAILGQCPASAPFTFAGTVSFIYANEISTVAAAYAMAGYATDATHVSSSGTALAQTGIANAFANAANLANLAAGTANTTTPGGNGTVPQSEIDTLGNILAACISTNGPGSNNCTTLFSNAQSAGSSGGAPTDTATAAINIAHNPGNGLSALFGLQVGVSSPFTPNLTSTPNDFTIGISFAGVSSPQGMAVDQAGNVWVSDNSNPASVTEFNGLGVQASGSPFPLTNPASAPFGLAIDLAGNAWVADNANASVYELTPAGAVAAGSPYGVGNSPQGVAIDGNGGTVWVTCSADNVVFALTSAGGPIGPFAPSGSNLSTPQAVAIDSGDGVWVGNYVSNGVSLLSSNGTVGSNTTDGGTGTGNPSSIAIDGNGDAWVVNSSGGSVAEFDPSLTNVTNSPFSGGGIGNNSQPKSVAIDGAGTVWISNAGTNNSITQLSSVGLPISPSTGYKATGLSSPGAIVADASGNIWVTNPGTGTGTTVTEFVGVSTPVATPLAYAISTAGLGQRP